MASLGDKPVITQVHSYDILVILSYASSGNNKDIILILGYNYNLSMRDLGFHRQYY